jgi:hypothetical protein
MDLVFARDGRADQERPRRNLAGAQLLIQRNVAIRSDRTMVAVDDVFDAVAHLAGPQQWRWRLEAMGLLAANRGFGKRRPFLMLSSAFSQDDDFGHPLNDAFATCDKNQC